MRTKKQPRAEGFTHLCSISIFPSFSQLALRSSLTRCFSLHPPLSTPSLYFVPFYHFLSVNLSRSLFPPFLSDTIPPIFSLLPHFPPLSAIQHQEDEFGPRWQPNQSPYTCAVSSPRKENKYHGIKSYISYAGMGECYRLFMGLGRVICQCIKIPFLKPFTSCH